MKFITPIVLAATLAVAAPTNFTESLLVPRSFQGSINWFTRWDCQNDCVEDGYCLSGQVDEGMAGSQDPWIGWDNGCWDRPAGAHSLYLSMDNGHKFSAVKGKSCAQFKNDGYVAETYHVRNHKQYGPGPAGKCNVLETDTAAVFYHW